ncbi:hypothetical protein FRC12_006057 [Ceratobasidium sp. 428]|nr:hypothetical protein FRC12_006057 [Ceratobasidium sp. 428]
MIEANVLVNLFESIAREVIFQERRSRLGRSAVFDGLLLPQSWALDIVRHSPQVDQQGWSPSHFLNALCQALKDMHSYEPGTRGKPGTSSIEFTLSAIQISWLFELAATQYPYFKNVSLLLIRQFSHANTSYTAVVPSS